MVVCTFCGKDRDLDLTRDGGDWTCDHCGTGYDRVGIEHRLIGVVQARLLKWHLQDLICARCRNVSMFSLRSRCTCSGDLGLELDREDMERRMTVFKGIAAFYRLEVLSEMLEFVLPSAEEDAVQEVDI